jgi:BMFP domain-containing protein YqiC
MVHFNGVAHQIRPCYILTTSDDFLVFYMQLKQIVEQLFENNREMLSSLDQEARLYSGMLLEKVASQLDLAYGKELESIEAALQRAERRVADLEKRLAELEGETKEGD